MTRIRSSKRRKPKVPKPAHRPRKQRPARSVVRAAGESKRSKPGGGPVQDGQQALFIDLEPPPEGVPAAGPSAGESAPKSCGQTAETLSVAALPAEPEGKAADPAPSRPALDEPVEVPPEGYPNRWLLNRLSRSGAWAVVQCPPVRSAPPAPLPAPAMTGLAAAAVGAQHLRARPPSPCQDAAAVRARPRPALVLADGAGSARVSHIGAEVVVQGLLRLLASTEDLCAELLDRSLADTTAASIPFKGRLLAHASGLLRDLALGERRAVEDFRCTLTLAVAGGRHLFWLRVGDSPLVVERDGLLAALGDSGQGEFANQTSFIDADPESIPVQWGLEPMNGITGIVAFSDGAADRLMSHDGRTLAPALGRMLGGLRDGQLSSVRLNEFLQDPARWQGTRGDDRSLALLACLPPSNG